MMKKLIILLMAAVMLISAKITFGYESGIVNGSFEDDGLINDVSIIEPNGWDVNIPPDEFEGWVYSDWVTEGFYNLTLGSYWYQTFYAGDKATVSQYVSLSDVNNIIIDLKLSTYPVSKKWNPTKRTAGILIDDTLVWEAYKPGDDLRGEYRDQFIPVNFEDQGLHKLSLALIADVDELSGTVDRYYYSMWDNIGFDFYCGGHGFLPGDFDRNCFVDFNDFAMFADLWQQQIDPNSKFNIYRDDDVAASGTINFLDYAVLAEGYDGNDFSDLQAFTNLWLDEVPPQNQWNLFREDDVPAHGMINFADLAVYMENWIRSSFD
jgi:hypothetical protein